MEKTTNKLFAELIKNRGTHNELETFDYCSNYGAELAGSTIDEITLENNGDIRFYYNINTGEFDSIEEFEENDLLEFYEQLVKALDDNLSLLDELIVWAKDLQKRYDDAKNNGSIESFANDAKSFIDTFVERGEEL